MTDKEIIKLLAEFMGWNYWDFKGDYEGEFPMYIINDSELIVYENKDYGRSWNPLENISDAWELVEKLKENYNIEIISIMKGVKWAYSINRIINPFNYYAKDKLASRAICMAVLKVIDEN